jgi:hypothetical protein
VRPEGEGKFKNSQLLSQLLLPLPPGKTPFAIQFNNNNNNNNNK